MAPSGLWGRLLGRNNDERRSDPGTDIKDSGDAGVSEPVRAALTVDVEDYYHAAVFRGVVRPEDWPSFESRMMREEHSTFWEMSLSVSPSWSGISRVQDTSLAVTAMRTASYTI